MKRFLYTLLVLVVIIAVGGYFLFIKAITPVDVPEKVTLAEEAVATQGTIAIASIDMTYFRHIDKLFNANKDPSPLPAIKSSDPKAEKSLLEKLEQQGINLTSQTDYALAAINVAQEKPAYSFVLFGRYQRDRLKQALSKYYLVDESEDGYWLLTQNMEEVVKDPCAAPAKKIAPKQHALHIQNDRIVLSSVEFMPVLLKRFAQKSPAGVSLANWRQFRKEKAVAGAIMSPKEMNKGAVDLPSALLLGALSEQPLNDVYAGAVFSLMPSPGVTIVVDAHANETAWPLNFKTKYDTWLSEAVLELKEMPTLAALLQGLDVQAVGNTLHVKAIVNKTTQENIEKVPGEFLQMAFSGVFDADDKAAETGEEQVVNDADIEPYAQQFDFLSVKPFDTKNVFYQPDYVAGPLAVRLERFGLLDTDNSIIELTINAEAKGFDNVAVDHMHRTTDTPVASLSIKRVEDLEGNNLLREELCGKSRNLAVESLSTNRDKEFVDGKWITKSIKISGKKSVRLKPGVDVARISKIKGNVAIRAATKTKIKTMQVPFARKTIETDKVRMYFRKSAENSVKYTLSGDMSRIMAVRAKNNKGQYLADSGSNAWGNDSKIVTKRFKGKVASIEVVVAEQIESKDYPFEINQVAPRYGKKGEGKKVEVGFTTKREFLKNYVKVNHNDECKDKQKVTLGAFMLCLNKFGDRWGRETGGEFDLVAPYEDALQNDISSSILSIDTVETESGEKIAFDKNDKAAFTYKFEATFNKKINDWEIVNRRLHAANLNVFSDKEELKGKKISTVNGTLTIRLPKNPKYFEFKADALGVVTNQDGISANIAAFEDWNTYIDLQGDVNKVLRFVPFAQDRTILNTGNDRINTKQYRTWGMSDEDKKKIDELPEKWQGMITIYGKPEKIRVFYANDFDIIKYPFQFSVQ